MKRRAGAWAVRSHFEDSSDSMPEYHRVHRRYPDDDNDNDHDGDNDNSKTKTARRDLSSRRWFILLLFAAACTTVTTLLSRHNSRNRTLLNRSPPSFYMPSLLVSSSDGIASPSSSASSSSIVTIEDWKAEWKTPLIHIVHTRFMQEQGNLTALGRARLHLFRVFCLPTMVQQTSQDFVWIIKTDPNLDQSLLQQLFQDISPYPNIYLVASLQNYRINAQFPGGWRGGAEPHSLSQTPIYTGNRRRLELAMALQEHLPILETRLDADDGLHLEFVETLQAMALDWFERKANVKWTYWCARRHMEWHWVDLLLDNDKNENRQQENKSSPFSVPSSSNRAYGSLFGTRHENLCITPGITVGFPVGTDESQVPIYAHDKIVVHIRHEQLSPEDGCGLDDTTRCLQFIENFVFCAIRSRTPTSAGMLHVLQNKADPDTISNVDPHSWLNYAYWDKLRESFGLKREHMKQLNQYLLDHVLEIAEENLLGQCTTGHSCKDKAKKALEELIELRRSASIAASRQ